MVVSTVDEVRTIGGTCIRYNVLSNYLFTSEKRKKFQEVLVPGCFDISLGTRDVIATVDHNDAYLLGRLGNGSLKLFPSETQIDIELLPANTTYGRDLIVCIERQDIQGMSFAFDVLRDEWEMVGDLPVRKVLQAELYEVSFVAMPAYPETSVDLRSIYNARVDKRRRYLNLRG